VGIRSRLWWVPLLAVVALAAGCGPAQPPASPSPSASSPAPTTPVPTPIPEPTVIPSATPEPTPQPTSEGDAVTRIEVILADGKADPNGEKVELAKGDAVEFVVTSDRDDQLHVHGVDVEIPVEAGETVTQRIVVDQTGRFEVESHHPELLIVQLVVR